MTKLQLIQYTMNAVFPQLHCTSHQTLFFYIKKDLTAKNDQLELANQDYCDHRCWMEELNKYGAK